MKNKNNAILNLIGLRCPEPIMIIRKKLRNMKLNQKILVLSDDPSTTRDIPNFCYFMNHTLLEFEIKIKPYRYLLKKGL
ncbi:sulfurtransferase TusA [Buchnera aphidicola]|uniref:Sulfur carrier protein TusA n=1 Tax=Buchnera aphidicola str. USDA (Myzus persicae) TaxID=1009856 RepID=W0NZP6_BUCMP|nr:sulfurtransferase TusA [Buchnera aphidicola]AHG59949.1 Yhhp [Buchnera aphidicola str. USDA (Myzus persicae)]AHG60529.1 Yhhp [Buchnera aphidicola str. W106 (Myzus persicae)]AHG61102.1 Yhhp [Buchnera aphidicola str. G002 (Myzus persicae)]AHG61674.1 Yhhp [Buchnera aphidicola str. F009 (Myzus persicae)]WAI03368.1 MAG: sulfurtransferase TusA [Buchnera aphidicola (Myzus persicae)]